MEPRMNPVFSLREATIQDRSAIYLVLSENKLSTHNVLVENTRYWLAETENNEPIGTIGIEIGTNAVLLRSASVIHSWKGRGVGTALTQAVLREASHMGIRSVYLFSTGAGDYWQKQGFQEVPVSEVVASLSTAPQVLQYEALGWLPTEIAWCRVL